MRIKSYESGYAHLYPYPYILMFSFENCGHQHHRIVECTSLQVRILIRYPESAIALDEEHWAEYARSLCHANHWGLSHDGAHPKVNFAVEYLVNGISGIFIAVVRYWIWPQRWRSEPVIYSLPGCYHDFKLLLLDFFTPSLNNDDSLRVQSTNIRHT